MATPTLAQIATEMAEYVENSDVEVTVQRQFPWVDIQDLQDPNNSFHLTDDSAEEFLAEADRLYNEARHISYHVAYYATAKPFVESWA